MAGGWACLHAHSWYSLMRGAPSPRQLAARAREAGCAAVALTDDNNLYGAWEHADACRESGVKPIFGARLKRNKERATVLIGEPAGYPTLCKVLAGLATRPKATLTAILKESSHALHVLSDDLEMLAELAPAYGRRAWVELIRPFWGPERERELVEGAKRLNLKVVASVGAHFAGEEDYERIGRLLAAVRLGVTLEGAARSVVGFPGSFLPTAAQIEDRFRDCLKAVANAELLASACCSDVLPSEPVLPPASVPKDRDPMEHLTILCEAGLTTKGLGSDARARARLQEEIEVAVERGAANFYLAALEVTGVAQKAGMALNCRGSAASSFLLYLLGVSHTSPLDFGLRQERCLHPARQGWPDIDLEVSDQHRHELLRQLADHYGPHRLACLCAIHHFREPSAFKEALKAHGLTPAQVGAVTDSLNRPLKEVLAKPEAGFPPPPPDAWPLEPERWQALLDDARLLLHRPQEVQEHPSAIVVTPGPAEELLPLEKLPSGLLMTQFDKKGVSDKFVKIDLLSSSALTALSEATALAEQLGVDVKPAAKSQEAGSAVMDLLARGELLAIPNLETVEARFLAQQMRPTRLLDLVQMMALCRPGHAPHKGDFLARRRGEVPATYPHPSLEEALKESWGIVLYEDDALRLIEALTGWDGSASERSRRRLANPETAKQEAQIFLAACEGRDVAPDVAQAALALLAEPGRYELCKAHAVSMAGVAWREVEIRATRPLISWTASLNHHQRGYPLWSYVEAAKRAGCAVTLPDVNRSLACWSQEVRTIRAGLSAVRGLSRKSVERILAQRYSKGLYSSVRKFEERLPKFPREDLEVLIRCGAFDWTGRGRHVLLAEAGLKGQAGPPRGVQAEEFEAWPFVVPPPGLPDAELWRDEWHLLGFLSGLPLMALFRPYLASGLVTSRGLEALAGREVEIAGLLAQGVTAPNGEHRLTMLDEHGLFEVRRPAGEKAPEGMGAWLARGRVDLHHGAPVVKAAKIEKVMPGAGRLRVFPPPPQVEPQAVS